VLVSVFADASYHHESRAGGWAGWAKSDRGSHYEGGPIRTPLASSTEAEFLAVVNAVHMSIKAKITEKHDFILIQSDCQSVEHILFKPNYVMTSIIKRARAHLMALRFEHQLSFSYRHVKGHSYKNEPRYAINRLCDGIAGRGMVQARTARGWRS